MAGLIQLETSGLRDKDFTSNPEYSYFREVYKRWTHFSTLSRELILENKPSFNQSLRFTIPQNCGDFLTKLSLKITLPGIDVPNVCYIEAVGHAIIEHARIFIGDKLIQHIPRDYLQIYSEHNVSLTHQKTLEEHIGKYPLRLNILPVSDPSVIAHKNLGKDGEKVELLIDIPFYFYKNHELAIPLSSITKQLVEVEIKLTDYHELLTDVNGTYPVSGVNVDDTIDASLVTELIFTDTKILKEQSYIITEIQENIFQMNTDEETFLLDFKNPIKELYFIVQREGVSPFDYDNSLNFIDDTYILFENLNTLELILDDQVILSKKTGNTRFLKAVQGYLHHTRTQIIRRFYSYSFALKPEEWYPTGQVNFSHIKNQILKVNLNRCDPQVPRYLKVYALSYNILSLKDGCIKKMY